MIPVADYVSRCSNGSASSLYGWEKIPPQWLPAIPDVGPCQVTRQWQGALARRKDRLNGQPKRSAVPWNERNRKSTNPQSPRNEDVGVLGARRIHGMQISKPSNPRMTHEHRPFQRSLGSNAINRGKIAAAVLRHFLHWSVSLCETRWRLHLHAQPP